MVTRILRMDEIAGSIPARSTMKEAIQNFNQQFEWEPQIENFKKLNLKKDVKIVIGGMGGSGLAGEILKMVSDLEIEIHKNYGLPKNISKNSLVICVSFSGNTEETIDFYLTSKKLKLPVIVISQNGKILELAKKNQDLYLKLPEINIPPRIAIGYMFKALAYVLNIFDLDKKVFKETKELKKIQPEKFEKQGRELAKKLKGYIPIIYSSEKNLPIAYNWKVRFNETSKMPAFYNVFPEMNHNEIEAFENEKLSKNFYLLLIKDENDEARIQKRMEIFEKIIKNKKIAIDLKGKNQLEKIFNNLILADWTSYYLAKIYKFEPERTKLIEQLKNLMQ